jgi:adenylate cyclase
MSETRKLAALLAADVAGYSRLAATDEERTVARLRGLRTDLIDPAISVHHGRVVKRTGDGILIEFRSVVEAVRCSIEVQNGMVERNAGLPPERHIWFRVGIHLGDVIEEADGDLMMASTSPRVSKVFANRVLFAFHNMPIFRFDRDWISQLAISATKN